MYRSDNQITRNARASGFSLLLASTMLAACTGVQSVPVGASGDTGAGQVYFLPTTRIPLSLEIDLANDRLELTFGAPQYVADETRRYILNKIDSPFHSEVYDVDVNDAGLLTSVSYTSDSRLNEAIKAGGRSFGFVPENQVAQTKILVTRESIDIGQLARPAGAEGTVGALAELNKRLQTALRKSLDALDLEGKPELSKLKQATTDDLFSLDVRRTFPAARPEKETDCSRGLCYRMKTEYMVTTTFHGTSGVTNPVYVPNGSRVYAAALERGLFTNWSSEIELVNGMPSKFRTQTTGSEAEGVLNVPATFVGGMIERITQQGKVFDSRATLVEAEAKYLAAVREAEAAALTPERAARENAPLARPLFTHSTGALPAGGAGTVPKIQSTGATTQNDPDDDGSLRRDGNDGTGG